MRTDLRALLKRKLPQRHQLRCGEALRVFGDRLHAPEIWHLNRRSCAGGLAFGVFLAWIPIPIQIITGAIGALWLRVNLPMVMVGVWITNPLTMAPAYLFAYRLGAWLLNHDPDREVAFEISLGWISATLVQIWQPLLLGCLTLAILSSVIGYWGMRLLWRLHLVRRWKERRSDRRTQATVNQL
jgi:uncharacterized protein (DUF2062 family)